MLVIWTLSHTLASLRVSAANLAAISIPHYIPLKREIFALPDIDLI